MPKKLQLQKLVGGIPTPLKHISQWEGLSHILWKKCLKPPTSSNSWLQILIHIAGQAGRSRKNRSLSCFIYVQYIHERPAIASHEPWNIPLSHSIKNTGQLQTIEWISSSSSKPDPNSTTPRELSTHQQNYFVRSARPESEWSACRLSAWDTAGPVFFCEDLFPKTF